MKEKVLFVDDEADLLSALKMNLRKHFKVETANSGEAGLEVLNQKGPFPVIISDMRMPGMNGAQFLTHARESAPDSVRMLLTGQADMQDTIAAVNGGHIFRFLTKPCPTDVLINALNAGIKQFQLVNAERELLEKTLKGSIRVFTNILSITNPDGFSRSARVRGIAKNIARRLHFEDSWQLDLASMFSQIGCITVPNSILKKKYQGKVLTKSENEIYSKHIQVGKDLLANIPRLENIAEAISYQEKQFDGGGPPEGLIKGKDIPILARILKVVHDYDELIMLGKKAQHAYVEMNNRPGWYDPDILMALEAEVMETEQGYIVKRIRIEQIEEGMVLADDIRGVTGTLLVPRRQEISHILKLRLLNFIKTGRIVEPIKILISLKNS